jgi:hypothetical protein
MRAVIRNSACLDVGREGAHHFVALVVDTSEKPAWSDRGETGVESLRRDAWKALRMSVESRELEGGCTRVDQLSDARRSLLRIDRRVEGKINARLQARL